ncbi:DNA-binding protein HEXBP-like [Solanum pennellii]|uniref:DNA-binding protein HEXBP-like n=1 Tax=Solanum pennellii TaxID=28526 RepID=A0ABM1GL38_SOLPN|nr:DNA-binding protein HEXBP-like [Solanum pennellii]
MAQAITLQAQGMTAQAEEQGVPRKNPPASTMDRELISFKGQYDRDSEPRVRRNSEVDTPQERPPCRKCDKLHGGECMMGSKACYCCGEPGHMMKDCPNKRGQEKGKEKCHPNSPSKEAPMRQQFFALKSRGAGEGTSGDVSGA